MSPSRNELLKTINQKRQKYNLPVWPNTKHLGKASEGEIEIVGLQKIIDDVKSHFVVFHYKAIYPNYDPNTAPKHGIHIVRESTRPIYCIMLRINGKYVFGYEHRPGAHKWCIEAYRGWGSPDIPRENSQKQVIGILARKMGKAFVGSWFDVDIDHLGTRWEDTSTRHDELQFFSVDVKTQREIPSSHENRKIRSYDSWEKVLKMERDGALAADLASSTLFRLHGLNNLV